MQTSEIRDQYLSSLASMAALLLPSISGRHSSKSPLRLILTIIPAHSWLTQPVSTGLSSTIAD